MPVKSTALTDIHTALGAKMVPFAGYSMPVSYSSIIEEHNTVRNGVGVFDVSHMGEFIIRGNDALGLIQRVTTNDAAKLVPGKVQYSCLTNDKGGIVDDLLVYNLGEGAYMLVVNASNIEKDWYWISAHNTGGAEMKNISDSTTLLAVQGPMASKALQPLTDVDLGRIPYYSFVRGKFMGIDNVIISATGYTGAGGFEIYFENGHAHKIWEGIIKAGAEYGIKPVGLGARDTLRLEMGYCLYGNDIDESTTPIEAGLGWITRLDAKEFTASAIIAGQKKSGASKVLVGFEMLEKAIPRSGYPITNGGNTPVGKVTSGTQSPSLGKAIGMGYIKRELAKEGTEIFITIRDRSFKAKIVKPPFYKPS